MNTLTGECTPEISEVAVEVISEAGTDSLDDLDGEELCDWVFGPDSSQCSGGDVHTIEDDEAETDSEEDVVA